MLAHGTIGGEIKELRKARKMTQSQLAERVGVTTQAVSKWECGGTPDAELLPDIATALGVSVDTLFGLSNEVKRDPFRSLAYDISRLPEEERFRRTIQYALSALIATAGIESLNDLIPLVTGVKEWKGKEHLMRMLEGRGFSVGNLTDGKQYFFAVYNPEEGYDGHLADQEHYRKLFAQLSRESVFRILLFLMHRHSAAAVLTGVIAKGVSLSEPEAEQYLTELEEAHLVVRRAVEGESGPLSAWSLVNDLHLLAVLILLRDIIEEQSMMINLDLLAAEGGALLRK